MTTRKLGGNIVEADKALAARLRLHELLHKTVLTARNPLVLILSPFYVIFTLMFLALSSFGLDSSNERFLIALCFTLPIWIGFSVEGFWRRNINHLARIDNIAVVGPLLDVADIYLRPRRNPLLPINRERAKHRSQKPISYDRWPEQVVLHHLPSLLTRMGAGDAPPLSKKRRDTLHDLANRPQFNNYFSIPGLSQKVEALLTSYSPSPRPLRNQ